MVRRDPPKAKNRWAAAVVRLCLVITTVAAFWGLWLLITRSSDRAPELTSTEHTKDWSPPAVGDQESVVTKAVPKAPEQPRQVATPDQPHEESKLEGLDTIPLKPWAGSEQTAEPEKPPVIAGGPKETLPWDLVEPVPFSPVEPAASGNASDAATAPQKAAEASLEPMPSESAIKGWLRATATEIKGLSDTRPMHHFEFWLDAPKLVIQQIAAVDYNFNTPAIMPSSQSSDRQVDGFRIRVGGLTCAESLTITLHFRDAQSKVVVVDGCKLLTPTSR
jgi:hypothetical protein